MILTYGPYAKGLAFQEGYPSAWQRMVAEHPDVACGSSNLYQSWEVVDPEKWVPHGLRLRARGFARRRPLARLHRSLLAARDEGFLQLHRVGGRAAVVERQGGAERHLLLRHEPVARRDAAAAAPRGDVHLGGLGRLVPRHDAPRRHPLHVLRQLVRHAGEDGPVRPRRARAALARHRASSSAATRRSPTRSSRRTAAISATTSSPTRSTTSITATARPVWEKVTTPFLSAANWGGQGLHPRGNFEGFVRAAAKEKWLEAHGIEHWTHFYTDYGRLLQKRFFDYFLKGEKNGWERQPKVQLQVRHVDRFVERHENEWPIARTQWTKFYLRSGGALRSTRAAGADGGQRHLRRAGRRRHLSLGAARERNRDHRAAGGAPFRLVRHVRRRPLPRVPRVTRRTCGKSRSWARSTRTRRSRRGGSAPRTASSTRSSRPSTGPITRTTRSSR